jgi:serine/threonine protein kinase
VPDPQLQLVAQEICVARGLTLITHAGEGTFKETFRVTDNAGGTLALKVYKPDYSHPEREAREIDAMTRCAHPNVGKLLHIGPHTSTDGNRYLYSLEEFFDGGTLTERLRTGPLSPGQVHALGSTLIRAVAHIASHDLVHRDLKPDNIIFRSDGVTPVVVDFGIVRDLGQMSLTPTHVPQGPCTPLFAAPEQLLNAKELIDWRTDQFALGVLLSVAGGGGHPYEEAGDVPISIVDRVGRRVGPSARFIAWSQSAGLAELARMVSPWPVQRFRTPDEIAAAWSAQRGAM